MQPSPVEPRPLHLFLASIFVFVATMMTFANAVRADFVNWDDDVYVTENPYVRELSRENAARIFTQPYFYSYIPVTLLSHAADVRIWGMNPKGHHLTNVVLHSFNAVWFFLASVLFLALRRNNDAGTSRFMERVTLPLILGAVIGTMLYATHPLRVEPVAWVSGRKDLLCAFFLFPAFGSYLLWREGRGTVWFVATHLLFVCALLSKPIAATFPLLLVLVDVFWPGRRLRLLPLARRIVSGKLLLFLFGATIAIITFLAAPPGKVNVLGDLNPVQRALFPLYSLVFYLWKTIAPVETSPIYPDLNRFLLYAAPVLLAGTAFLCVVMIKRSLYGVAAALLSYGILLFPTFLGLSSGMQPLADRYSYLATAGIFLFLGGSAEWLWQVSTNGSFRRRITLILLVVLCGISAYRTIRHIAIWNNSIALWSHAVWFAPTTREEFNDRRPYLKPDYLDAYLNLGVAHAAAGNTQNAIEQFNTILTLNPTNADAHYNLGTMLYEQGKVDSARVCFLRAIAGDSTYAKAYFNLGVLYAYTDSSAIADEWFVKAARLGYTDAQQVLLKKGKSW